LKFISPEIITEDTAARSTPDISFFILAQIEDGIIDKRITVLPRIELVKMKSIIPVKSFMCTDPHNAAAVAQQAVTIIEAQAVFYPCVLK
jgi:hypothetical protein